MSASKCQAPVSATKNASSMCFHSWGIGIRTTSHSCPSLENHQFVQNLARQLSHIFQNSYSWKTSQTWRMDWKAIDFSWRLTYWRLSPLTLYLASIMRTHNVSGDVMSFHANFIKKTSLMSSWRRRPKPPNSFSWQISSHATRYGWWMLSLPPYMSWLQMEANHFPIDWGRRPVCKAWFDMNSNID